MSNFIFLITTLITFYGGTLSKIPVHEYANREWHTGTMTPYEVFGNLDDTPIKFPDWEPKKLWFVGRHATRFPAETTLEAMFGELKRIQKEIPRADNPCYSEGLKTWDPPSYLKPKEKKDKKSKHVKADDLKSATDPAPASEPNPLSEDQLKTSSTPEGKTTMDQLKKSLTPEGKMTMAAMGERFRTRFQGLIPVELDERTEFKFTTRPRTKESAFSFAAGLYGHEPPRNNPHFYEATPTEYLLKFDTYCLWWKLFVKKTTKMKSIFKAYENGEEMGLVLKSVKERCLLQELDRKTLIQIYMTCSYELAWHDESPWCNFFENDAQLDILEYVEDLKLYNTSAYGNAWNYRIACPMLNDMLDFLTSESNVLVRFSFSHAKTLIKFSAHLGLFKYPDEILTESTYKFDRKWASSKFAGFSFNFTFILYESKNGEQALLLMLNERAIKIPKCPDDTYLCPLETFKNIPEFHESIHKCEFDTWCRHDEFALKYDEYVQQFAKEEHESQTVFGHSFMK